MDFTKDIVAGIGKKTIGFPFTYVFALRGDLKGPRIFLWSELPEEEAKAKPILLGMKLSNQANMGSGILLIRTASAMVEQDIQDFQCYLRGMSPLKFGKFLKTLSVWQD